MAIEINDLPVELIEQIFEFVAISDLFNLRLTCKKMQTIIAHVKIKELVFDADGAKKVYYHTNRPKVNVINVQRYSSKLNLLQSQSFNLKHLERLSIDSLDGDKFVIENLNKFVSRLVQLEIHHCKGCEGKLSLPNLSVLNLNTIYSSHLVLDAPKLSVLCCKINIDLLELPQPDCIKHLEIYAFKDKVFSFVNLECLKLDHADHNDFRHFFAQNILQKLSKLKEITFQMAEFEDEYFYYTMESIRNLLNDKKKLGRTLKISFKDRLILDEEQIANIRPIDFFDDLVDSDTTSDRESESLSDYVYYDDLDGDYDDFSDFSFNDY